MAISMIKKSIRKPYSRRKVEAKIEVFEVSLPEGKVYVETSDDEGLKLRMSNGACFHLVMRAGEAVQVKASTADGNLVEVGKDEGLENPGQAVVSMIKVFLQCLLIDGATKKKKAGPDKSFLSLLSSTASVEKQPIEIKADAKKVNYPAGWSGFGNARDASATGGDVVEMYPPIDWAAVNTVDVKSNYTITMAAGGIEVVPEAKYEEEEEEE